MENIATDVKTREIAEAAILYMNNMEMVAYVDKHWFFDGDKEEVDKLKKDLINKKLKVEPLEFMDAIRRVKSFSNGL